MRDSKLRLPGYTISQDVGAPGSDRGVMTRISKIVPAEMLDLQC